MMVKRKRISAIIVMLITLMLLGSIPVLAASPKISQKKVTIYIGNTLNLTVSGAGVTKWTSSDESVATVNDGSVTAKKVGTAVIRAYTKKKTLSCKVTVEKAAKLNTTRVVLAIGKSATLKVKNAAKKVKWNSRNPEIVSVTSKDAKAKIKGLQHGRTVVTATVGKQSLTCDVTVQRNVRKPVSNIEKWVTTAPRPERENNEFWYPQNNIEAPGRVEIRPRHMYYYKGRLYAECYIINGINKTVKSIDLIFIQFNHEKEMFAKAGFGIIQLNLKPHEQTIRTFCFPEGYAIMNADLTISHLKWNWNNKIQYLE